MQTRARPRQLAAMQAFRHSSLAAGPILQAPPCCIQRSCQQLPPVEASLPALSLAGRSTWSGRPFQHKQPAWQSSRGRPDCASVRSALVTEPSPTEVETNETKTSGTKIEEVAPGVWTFTQSLGIAALGLDPLLRMTAIKLPNGDVWLHSPVALNADVAARLAALGPVRHLVISNNSPEHGFFARGYAKAYPEARIYAPVPLRQLSIAVRWGLPQVDEVLGDEAPAAWAGVIDQVVLDLKMVPNPPIEALFCHRPTGVLLASDTMLYADERSAKFAFNRSNFKTVGMWKQVGGLMGLIVRDEKRRQKAQNVIDALRSWPYDTLVFSHLSSPVPDGRELMYNFLGTSQTSKEET